MKVLLALLLLGCVISAQAYVGDVEHIGGFGGVGGVGAEKKKGLGPLAQLVELLVEAAKGVVTGVDPIVSTVYKGVVPILRVILDFLEIHVCAPDSVTSLALWDVGGFYNTKLIQDIPLAEIKDLCKPEEIKFPTPEIRYSITRVKSKTAGASLDPTSSGLDLPGVGGGVF